MVGIETSSNRDGHHRTIYLAFAGLLCIFRWDYRLGESTDRKPSTVAGVNGLANIGVVEFNVGLGFLRANEFEGRSLVESIGTASELVYDSRFCAG